MAATLVLTALVPYLATCSPADVPEESVSDSAVEWEVGPPISEFSAAVDSEGDSTFLFRVTEVTVLSDELIGFGSSRTEKAMAIVDTAGRLVFARGDEGDAPGEFRSVAGLYSEPDGIAVWDGRLRRMTRYDDDGELLRNTVRIPLAIGESPLGLDSSGRFWSALGEAAPEGSGLVFHGWDRSGVAVTRTVSERDAHRPLRAVAHVRGGPGGGPITLNWLSGTCLPKTLFGWLGGAIAVVDTGSGEVLTLGDEALTLRATASHRTPVTEEMRSRIREEVRVALPAERTSRPPFGGAPITIIVDQRVIDSVASAAAEITTVSYWDRVLSAPSGDLWLRRANCMSDEPEWIWDVLSPDGVWTSTLSVPADRRLRAVGEDIVVTERRDEFDVVHFGVHQIVR